MNEYLDIFVDKSYPDFINKYLNTKTMRRLKYITQFCGCDYTKLYSPLFLYTRYNHSLVVAHMTWHFTHDKKQTIAALLHDVGTPCFAHCIDPVFGDYLKQESSERNVVDVLKKDWVILKYLKDDGISLMALKDFSKFYILENKSPRLCTDRLDGVLHTCYVWLHTHPWEQIKEVYDNLIVLENEDGKPEIGFKDIKIAEKFVLMVYNYAKELQGNKDKYILEYVCDMVKLALDRNLISLDDLYEKKEEEICNIFSTNFLSWDIFTKASKLIETDIEPKNKFYISFATKKRNTIFLVKTAKGCKRITEVSNLAKEKYQELENIKIPKYAYVEELEKLY